MRITKFKSEISSQPGIPEQVLTAGVRLLRLASMSAVFALLAGAGASVYAQSQENSAAPAETATAAPAAPVVSTPTDAASAQPQPEPIYEVLPGELMPTQPSVLVVAKSSVPPEASPQTAAAGAGKKGKKKKKEKAPKLTPVHIEQGTLTVDGWTGKARLNYDIADLKYIYLWAPGIGTVVASNQKFPMGTEQKNAFNGNSLTVDAKGHQIQITSENRLLKDKKPASAWVYIDTVYKAASMFPQMGYGATKDAPYAWPGAKDRGVEKGVAGAPPLPAGMRPMIARPTCLPAGTGSTTANPTPIPCPAGPGKPAVSPSRPAAAPPVPLPGYSSGTTTASVAASGTATVAK